MVENGIIYLNIVIFFNVILKSLKYEYNTCTHRKFVFSIASIVSNISKF